LLLPGCPPEIMKFETLRGDFYWVVLDSSLDMPP
jgi:hypothetical protein